MPYSKNQPIAIEVAPKIKMTLGVPVSATWTTDSRPENPRWGEWGYNTDTGCVEVYSARVGKWTSVLGSPSQC